MRFFISHSYPWHDGYLAMSLSHWLRRQGHVAASGAELTGSASHFSHFSFDDKQVQEHIAKADALIALALDTHSLSGNVGAEMAFFLANASKERLITVAGNTLDVPVYLRSGREIRIVEQSSIISHIGALPEMALDLLIKEVLAVEKSAEKSKHTVFLSYAREDSAEVDLLSLRLSQDGFRVWHDKRNLLPGHDWNSEIAAAIDSAKVFVCCLSSNSVGKRGVVQQELRRGLEAAERVPEGDIFIVPLLLDECAPPNSLNKYQWCKYYESAGYDSLRETLDRVLCVRVGNRMLEEKIDWTSEA